MLTYKSILVPIDGSEGSILAMKTAQSLAANHSEAKITALYIDDHDRSIFSSGYYHPQSETELSYREKGERVVKIIRDAVPDAIFEEEFLKGGNPGDQILYYASHNDTDLVVMATRGLQKAARRMFLGSTTNHVIQNLKVPVLIIPVD